MYIPGVQDTDNYGSRFLLVYVHGNCNTTRITTAQKQRRRQRTVNPFPFPAPKLDQEHRLDTTKHQQGKGKVKETNKPQQQQQ